MSSWGWGRKVQRCPKGAEFLRKKRCETRFQPIHISSTLYVQSRHSSWSMPNSSFQNSELYLINKKISNLTRTGRLSEARMVFDNMVHRNIVSWNTMISGYTKRREMANARKLFDEMPEKDIVSWNSMISGYVSCGGSRFLVEGRNLFDTMPLRDCVSWNTIISGYAKNRRMDEALRLFDSMPERNVVSWNSMIAGFLQNGEVELALKFFKITPSKNAASLSGLISGLIQNEKLDEAAGILVQYRDKKDANYDLVGAYNTLIAGYGHRGKVDDARYLFDQIPCIVEHGTFKRNVVSWNTMIMCCVKARDVVSAREVFDQMTEQDSFSWNTMIYGYTQLSDMQEASRLFWRMPCPDIFSWNTMISGFTDMGNLKIARNLFEKMPQKNLISWNSIIAGYEKCGEYKEAVVLFVRMLNEGEKPDQHTLSSVLSICAGLANLHFGVQLHQIVTKTIIPDLPISNALITMYAKCGAINEARSIFNAIEFSKNAVTWNSMIGGYASHGLATECLALFETMKRLKVQPTYITFISVLSACAHAGLVEKGELHFNSMVNEYGIKPTVQHYASLVDIIGRFGSLKEAMDVINNMPIEPDKTVWGSLLGACRVHNNVDLGRIAAEALMRLEPESSAAYILLYNMYVDVGRFDDATQVRMMMERNGIHKAVGHSRNA